MWFYGLLSMEDWHENVEDHATSHLIEPLDPEATEPELTEVNDKV